MNTARILLLLIPLGSWLHGAPPPELTVLRQQYDKVVAERVAAPFEAALGELNAKYSAGLDRAVADAKSAGKLEDIISIEAEKKRLVGKLPVPEADDGAEPEMLKKLRGIYRQQHIAIIAARDQAQSGLLPAYTAKLKELEVVLVKNDRVEEAKEVLTYRQALGTATPPPATATAAVTPAAVTTPPAMPADAPKVRGDDRKAAEWVLANWSESRLIVDSKLVKTMDELPKGKFAVTGFSIDGRYYTGKAPLEKTVLLENLGGLAEVRSVTLGSFPDLKDEDLSFIGTLTSLDELRLAKMSCTDAVLGHLKRLKKLGKLEFGELPNLTGTGFAELAELPMLDWIVHWKGGATDEGVAALAKLPELESLDIQANPGVTNACIPSLRAMSKLTSLCIAATNITPDGFGAAPMPKITNLAGNNLAKLPLSKLAPQLALIFPNVESFLHSHFANTAEDLSALAHFKKLKKFTNAGTIQDIAWPGLLELRDLAVFQVYSNPISDATWQMLAKIKKLKVVRYGNKPTNETALAAFKKQRPDVKLEP